MLLAVVGTLFFSTQSNRQKEQFKAESRRQGQFGQMLKKELGLSPDQEKKFKEFKTEFDQAITPVFDSLSKKRIAMVKELSKSKPDTAILYSLSDEIGMLHAQLKRKTVDNILKMKGICTPEQLTKFDSLSQRLIGPEGPMHRGGPNKGKDFNNGR
jgi:Spy/CpxP family protein refolding chaperone